MYANIHSVELAQYRVINIMLDNVDFRVGAMDTCLRHVDFMALTEALQASHEPVLLVPLFTKASLWEEATIRAVDQIYVNIAYQEAQLVIFPYDPQDGVDSVELAHWSVTVIMLDNVDFRVGHEDSIMSLSDHSALYHALTLRPIIPVRALHRDCSASRVRMDVLDIIQDNLYFPNPIIADREYRAILAVVHNAASS